MAGRLILVVGPSGAGKDTLLAAAQDRLRNKRHFLFPRRMITRPADSGGEDHIAISWDKFRHLTSHGEYTLAWQAHGLGYLLPAEISGKVASGHMVICNVSRGILKEAVDAFPDCRVILITASKTVRAHRLASRGRESIEEIRARLDREPAPIPAGLRAITIDNSGDLALSIDAFCDAIQTVAFEPVNHRRPA